MAITADVNLGNGVTASGSYIIIPVAYIKKFAPESDGVDAMFKLIYDVHIYQNKSARDDYNRSTKLIYCRALDHFKIDYDISASDNPFVLAYTHLKTNGNLSNISEV